jgi:hypothetical protein
MVGKALADIYCIKKIHADCLFNGKDIKEKRLRILRSPFSLTDFNILFLLYFKII